jgi:Uma2 family endonuclease
MIDKQVVAELEEQMIVSLSERVANEPRLRQLLLQALQKSGDVAPKLETFEAFIAWVDEDMSVEWDDGELVFMSPASLRHQLVKGFLYQILQLFVQQHGLGVVLDAPFKMKLQRYGPEPDILFVARAHEGRLRDSFLDGPADMVVEIISPESIDRDRGRKFLAYEAAGVGEYWLIDVARTQAEFYRLDATNGRYQHIPLQNGRFSSQTLPGFWLLVDWLWANPLPSVLKVVGQLGLL